MANIPTLVILLVAIFERCMTDRCPEYEFPCDDGVCRHIKTRCDGVRDCKDHSDEVNCASNTCKPNYFRCNNGQCVPEKWRCDGGSDCVDGSDEASCGSPTTPPSTTTTSTSATTTTTTQPLSERQPMILVVTNKTVWGVSMTGSSSPEQLQNLTSSEGDAISSFDVDIRRNVFCWTASSVVKCDWFEKVTQNSSEWSIGRDIKSPRGVAIDWTSAQVYWTDMTSSGISVTSLYTTDIRHKVTLTSGLDSTDNVVLDPSNRRIYISENGNRIKRYSMDGGEEELILERPRLNIRGMALDEANGRLYWVDSRARRIWSSNLDGKTRRGVLRTRGRTLQNLAVFTNSTDVTTSVYWSDGGTLYKYNIDKNQTQIILQIEDDIRALRIYTRDVQPDISSPCQPNSCGHQQVCLSKLTGFRCVCADGLQFQSDGKRCVISGSSSVLLAVTANKFWGVPLRSPSLPTDLPMENGLLGHVTGVDIDMVRRIACWSDSQRRTVMCGQLGQDQEFSKYWLVSASEPGAPSRPSGVAVDWVSQLVLWTDVATGSLSVASLREQRPSQKVTLLSTGLADPTYAVIDPIKKWIFVSESDVRIQRYNLDGSGRTLVVEDNVSRIRGLAIDVTDQRLYWLDSGKQLISSCNLDGTNKREMFRTGRKECSNIALYTDPSQNKKAIYWSEPGRIKRLYLGEDEPTEIFSHVEDFTSLKVLHTDAMANPADKCEGNRCTDICIPVGQSHNCACGDGRKLEEDGFSCVNVDLPDSSRNCASMEFTCKRGSPKCVAIFRVCDGRSDCKDNSDEGKFCSSNGPTYLLSIEAGDIWRTLLDGNYSSVEPMSAPHDGTRNAARFDLDIRRQKIFFTKRTSILRADFSESLHVTKVRTIFYDPSVDIIDLSVDWTHGLIFWTDKNSRTVSATTYDGSFTKVIHGSGWPGSLAVDPNQGVYFLADTKWRPQVVKCKMTGGCSRLMPDLADIGDVVCDFKKRITYWTEMRIKALMSVTMEGYALNVVSDPQQGRMTGAALYNNWMYVSDLEKKTIRRADPVQKTWEDVRQDVDGPRDLVVLNVDTQPMVYSGVCSKEVARCTHICIPKENVGECACPPPMVLSGTHCLYKDLLLFLNENYITRVDVLRRFDGYYKGDSFRLADGYSDANPRDLDFDIRNNAIYWTDSGFKGIFKSSFNAESKLGKIEKILSEGVYQPEAIAVDWIEQNVYWSELANHSIMVASLRTRQQTTLIGTDIAFVGAIVLDPRHRYLYWTSYGHRMYSRIERSGLDGSDRQLIISDGLFSPNGLTIDYEQDRLFVLDAGKDSILSCSLASRQCHPVYVAVGKREFTSIALGIAYDVGTDVFWGDLKTDTVEVIRADGTKKQLITSMRDKPRGLVIFHKERQPVVPPACDEDNNGCLICLPNAQGEPKCACPDGTILLPDGMSCSKTSFDVTSCEPGFTFVDGRCQDVNECDKNIVCSQICHNSQGKFHCSCYSGYSLDEDGRTCRLEGPAPYLMVADGVQIQLVTNLNSGSPHATRLAAHHTNFTRRTVSLDFDITDGKMFCGDTNAKAITMADWNGSIVGAETILLQTGVEFPESVACDWIHKQVYWVDSRLKVIRVIVLGDHRYHRTVHRNLDRPRTVALNPTEGQMYWTDWGRAPRIERSNMDGSARNILISTNIVWPNGLTIDYNANRLYWADGQMGALSSCDMGGNDRKVIFYSHSDQLQRMFSLAVVEDRVYWTDWSRRSLHSITKMGTNQTTYGNVALRRPLDLKVWHPVRQMKGTNRCGDNNGGCSHICSSTSGTKGYTCTCPDDLKLTPGARSCV